MEEQEMQSDIIDKLVGIIEDGDKAVNATANQTTI